MKKLSKIDESAWGDMMRRGSGEDIRKEDDLTNLKEIVPIDMGVSVLWADRDLEYKIDDTCYLTYEDAESIFKNTGWRFPTKEETLELFKYTRIMKNTDNVCILEGDFDGGPQLIFNKNGYKLGNSDQLFKEYCYCCWTSTEYKPSPEAYYMMNIQQYQSHIPMHKENRVPARLVKDKEKRED